MRKFAIATLVFFLPLQVFADDVAKDCSIRDGVTAELSTYLSNVDTVLSAIPTDNKCQPNANGKNSATASIEQAISSIVGTINNSLSLTNFFTSTRFYVGIALKTEVPPGFTRDHTSLIRSLDRIERKMEDVYARCATDLPMPAVSMKDANYSTDGKKVDAVLKDMLGNASNMLNFYRETVLGDNTEGDYSLILIPKDFETSLAKTHGPKAFECSAKKEPFFKKITDAIDKIANFQWSIATGIKEWEKAWALLNQNSSNVEYAVTERKVLRDEMARQGMNGSQTQIILNNLKACNDKIAGQGVSGALGCIGDNMKGSFDSVVKLGTDVMKAITNPAGATNPVWSFFGIGDKTTPPVPKTTDEYEKMLRTVGSVTDINAEIVSDYKRTQSLISSEILTSDMNISSLADTHLRLVKLNQYLQPYIKVSEKVCNSQNQGEGNCSFR